jgi:hypothetical protein
MIDIKTALELAKYKISGGSDYLWKCFGPNARWMDFEFNPNNQKFSFSMIFDSVNQTVYEVTVCDYVKQNCYRMLHPDYIDQYEYESLSRNVNWKQAYDNVEYIDLDVDEDFIEKANAILNELPYDERVVIAIDLPNDLWFVLMKKAHELDITLNKYIEQILEKAIEDSVFDDFDFDNHMQPL